ncbi:ccch-type zn-finger protein [Moniliophthora roreri MCA 2997]|uniref:Ccch-type zn-finger protein n=2 Tax=Moniliophthora roreri TaxID=221103 RepID=V2Y074_MONRO|nr:ccch-type zn-finger protein [Moniliophthora roreri MCA 2997]KAI3621998.1 ccch-type zn-finger protein [Moniliophthora roreri]
MHEAFTTKNTTRNNASILTNELLPPFLTNRPDEDLSLWSSPYDSDKSENWQVPQTIDSPTSQVRRSPYPTIPKIFSGNMAARPDSNPRRWLLKNNNQVVDADTAAAGWDLADEIVRLNIGDTAKEQADDAPIRTPPKSDLTSTLSLADASPLETNSIPSADSSPHASDHHIVISHSRGSSTDTTVSSQGSHMSGASGKLLAQAPTNLKTGAANELKERPHSFSGGLSTAELRRLQQAGEGPSESDNQLQQQQQQHWPSTQYREAAGEQLSYPSLTPSNVPVARGQPQYDGRSGFNRDEGEYQRNFVGSLPPQAAGMPPVPTSPPYMTGRPAGPYRQPPRAFPPQTLAATGYGPPHHTSLSLGNTQQLYDMMLPGAGPENPAIPRVQQQHNMFRGAHHHSASDPSQIRDVAALGLLNGTMQAFSPGLYPTNMPVSPPAMAMYPGQFYGAQDAYRDPAVAQVMASRLQAQYTGPYGVATPQIDTGIPSPGSSTAGSGGPSANNRKLGLYKTELCRSWEEKGSCRYGAKCQFAHGEQELRKVARHPKYKTEICRTFWVSGSCPYGKRCCFIHTELPTVNAGAPGAVAPPITGETTQPQPSVQQTRIDGRERSLSTNSDPNDGVSLLARINATKRPQESSTPVDNKPNGLSFSRPPTGSLRVDTSVLDANLKQNKSAYPTFANNGVLLPASEQITAKSPAPVTAGPDLGRHNNARLEIVGYNQARMNKSGTPPANARHTASGSDDFGYNYSQTYSVGSDDGSGGVTRANGHVRAGSAGNWGNFSARGSHLNSAYPSAASPVGEASLNSPWTATELTMGSSRLNEKAWA